VFSEHINILGWGSERDPDVKGTETKDKDLFSVRLASSERDPDVKGTETVLDVHLVALVHASERDPDVKGTETTLKFAYLISH